MRLLCIQFLSRQKNVPTEWAGIIALFRRQLQYENLGQVNPSTLKAVRLSNSNSGAKTASPYAES